MPFYRPRMFTQGATDAVAWQLVPSAVIAILVVYEVTPPAVIASGALAAVGHASGHREVNVVPRRCLRLPLNVQPSGYPSLPEPVSNTTPSISSAVHPADYLGLAPCL